MPNYMMIMALLLSLTIPLFSQGRLTVSCEEPKGNRIDFRGSKFTTSTDGFTGVNPIFIHESTNPERLMFIWSATRIIPKHISPDKVEDATVVTLSENQITAVYVDPSGDAILIFSLFPKQQVVYFTQHRYLFGSIPNTSSYSCKCTFNFVDN